MELFVSDVDGTLVQPDERLSDFALSELARLRGASLSFADEIIARNADDSGIQHLAAQWGTCNGSGPARGSRGAARRDEAA